MKMMMMMMMMMMIKSHYKGFVDCFTYESDLLTLKAGHKGRPTIRGTLGTADNGIKVNIYPLERPAISADLGSFIVWIIVCTNENGNGLLPTNPSGSSHPVTVYSHPTTSLA